MLKYQLLFTRSAGAAAALRGGPSSSLFPAAATLTTTTTAHPKSTTPSPPSVTTHRPYSSTPPPSSQYNYNDGGGGGQGLPSRAFPQYTIFNDAAVLQIKPILPTFKPAGGDGVSVDRPGRMMMSFTPRQEASHPPTDDPSVAQAGTGRGGISGAIRWQEQLSIALSVEEVGLLIDQLPAHEVELCRQARPVGAAEGTGNMEYGMNTAQISDAPDKVLTVRPGEGATVSFTLDYVRDGVGGQISPLDDHSVHAPLEIVAHAGEFMVLKKLLESSVPHLLGWNTMMDIGVLSMMRQGTGGGGGGRY